MHRVLQAVLASPLIPNGARGRLLRRIGVQVGERVTISARAWLGSDRISFGDHVFVNVGLFYDGDAPVVVGDGVAIGPHVRLVTSSHATGPSSGRGLTTPSPAPISIEDGCWLGAGAMVLPGVTVRRGCVIGAGAVVHRSTEPDGLYVGVPATRRRDLPKSPADESTSVETRSWDGGVHLERSA